jgi:hypothetical protein
MPVGPLVEFLSSISQEGVAKTSHFRFTAGVKEDGNFPDIARLLSIRCETTELPGRQLVTNDSRVYGPSYKTTHSVVYQEITLSFVETSNFVIRSFFETWLNSIFSVGNNLLSYPNATRFDCFLTQYDVMFDDKDDEDTTKTGKSTPTGGLRRIAEWTLKNSFPTAINQMPVSWSEDGIHRTTVTLAFEYYILWASHMPTPKSAEGNISNPFPVPPKGSSGGVFQSSKSKFI